MEYPERWVNLIGSAVSRFAKENRKASGSTKNPLEPPELKKKHYILDMLWWKTASELKYTSWGFLLILR